MQQKVLTITNRLGLHARAAAKLVKLAGSYQSNVLIARADARHKAVDAKSIFSVLLLAATQGTAIEILTEGADEEAAAYAIERLIEGKFGEE